MPYIKQELRLHLDKDIENLANSLKRNAFNSAQEAGMLNYTITCLLSPWLEGGVSYGNVNMLVGVLECVKQELYRRAAAPYEDMKMKDNGDVITYV